jgi:hypothetical protein
MMDEFFRNFNNVEEFNYSVHISEDFHFVYFNNPKCACTTIKASLNLACAAAIGRHLQYKSIADIHDRDHNLLLRPDQVGYARFKEMLDDSSYFKFCFLREPVQRIASAFASKLTWPSESLACLNRLLHRSEEATFTFPGFIETLLSHEEVRDMDEHWRLQGKQICFNAVRFDMIGLFEDLESNLRTLSNSLFGNSDFDIFDARLHYSENTSDSRTLTKNLPEELRQVIQQIYADDILLYRAVADREVLYPAPDDWLQSSSSRGARN